MCVCNSITRRWKLTTLYQCPYIYNWPPTNATYEHIQRQIESYYYFFVLFFLIFVCACVIHNAYKCVFQKRLKPLTEEELKRPCALGIVQLFRSKERKQTKCIIHTTTKTVCFPFLSSFLFIITSICILSVSSSCSMLSDRSPPNSMRSHLLACAHAIIFCNNNSNNKIN